ncbi:MAG: nitroreductase family deazaflavin-dependent oxidoreductase [Actinomycetota bacterium]|nr:nitroreductase family deazaflavin-dependent oxidoreductase [Actinomycetota bacterium]
MTEVPHELRDERYCYLTTTQRVTGRRHTAELWFVPAEGGVYLFSGSGGLTTWCLNLQASEQGVVRIDGRSWLARAAFLGEDDERRVEALNAFHDKYDPPGKDRTEPWIRNAVVAHVVLVREVV